MAELTPPAGEFSDFIKRIRAGDADAATELVRKYEKVIRLEVRMRLHDPRLGRVFDSMDICQSVMASFFVRAAAGQFEMDDPNQLVRLLVGMTRNKLAFAARKQRAAKRDNRRIEGQIDGEHGYDAPAQDPTPSRLVAGKELLAEFRKRFTKEERDVADLRFQGMQWQEIADQIGGTAQARRKQFERALDRISAELGLDATE